MFDERFREVESLKDPLELLKQSTELLTYNHQLGMELARLRRQAVDEAIEVLGMSYSQIAQEAGLSKGRIGQIRKSAPPAERKLFGIGPVQVAVPLREKNDRAFHQVDLGDLKARENVAALLKSLYLQHEEVYINPSDEWQLQNETIAICGPKTSPVISECLKQDKNVAFEERSAGIWDLYIRNQEIWATDSREFSDYGYLAKLPVTDGFAFIIAGIHSSGSIGVTEYLSERAEEIFMTYGESPFSMVIGADVSDGEVLRSAAIYEGALS